MAEERRPRVVSLIRVSTLKQKKDKEADYQRNQVKLTCSGKNLELVKEFPLENISGLDVRQTEQFKELRRYIARPDIDGMVLPSMDRLCRTTEFRDVAALMAPFEAILGKTRKLIWTRNDVFDVSLPDDRDRIWNSFKKAEAYRADLKFMTTAQKDLLRLEADTKVDKTPKGIIFTHIPGTVKPKRYVFTYDPDYRKLINAAYPRVLNDEDLTDIATDLGYGSINGMRETLKSEWWIGYKSRLKTMKGERQWLEDEQKYFIGGRKNHTNPIRVAVPNLVADPAVERKVWDLVQEKLAQHTDLFRSRKAFSETLLASGFLYCGVCGEAMYHKGQKSRTHPGYYWCKSKAMSYHKDAKKKTVDCGMGLIRVDLIEDDIKLQIQMHLGVKETCRQLLNDAANVEALEEKKRYKVRIKGKIAEQNEEKSRMLKAIRKGIATEDDYADDLEEVRRTIESLESKASSIQDDIDATVSDEMRERWAVEMADDFRTFANDDFKEQVRKLNKHIRKITATKVVNPMTDEVEVQLHFVVKPGMPLMLDQTSPVRQDTPSKPPRPPSSSGKPIEWEYGGTISGGVAPIPTKGSNLKRRSISSSSIRRFCTRRACRSRR